MRSKRGELWEEEQLGAYLRKRDTHPVFAKFTKFWSALYLFLFALFVFMLLSADILPLPLLLVIIVVLALASALLFPMLFFKNIKFNRKVIATIISTILMIVYIYGAIGLGSIAGFFAAITGDEEAGYLAKPVNVKKEPFNIYISGLDVSGSIDTKSRSDVNMIMTVNPRTHKILLTSIPRDTLIRLTTKDNAQDKLTHTGIYGIKATIRSAEDLTGLDMNYFVKVNYSTVRKFVDSIGGIDVKSDYEFDTHGMKAKYHFVKGVNHLNGDQALAFARERKSFPDGDIQRNKNQAKVMQAMIKKGSSSKTILLNYTTILNSCKDYMQINMTNREVKSLVKMQIAKGYHWKVKRQNISGTPTFAQCYSTGAVNVSVIQPDPASLEKCVGRITRLMEQKE